jgi:hypothetical protein
MKFHETCEWTDMASHYAFILCTFYKGCITACKNTHFAWVAGGRVLISTPDGFSS